MSLKCCNSLSDLPWESVPCHLTVFRDCTSVSSIWGHTISSRALGQTRQCQLTLLHEPHEGGEDVSGEAALGGSGVLMEWLCGNGAEVEAVDVDVIQKCEVWVSDESPRVAETMRKGGRL